MTGKPRDLINYLLEQDKDKLFDIEEHKDTRSRNANRLLWQCLGEIAGALMADKWDIYLKMLKRYGKFTYVCVRPGVVEAVKKQWRESEEIGEIDINGQKSIQLLCYFGSHTYDKKEFAILLDGVISEMSEMGIPTPAEKDLERALENWNMNEKKA